MNVSVIKSGNSITAVFPGGKVLVADCTAKNWDAILAAAKVRDWDSLQAELDILYAVNKKSNGRAELIDGKVYLDGSLVQGGLGKKILDMFQEGWTIDPMLRFLENVAKNPAQWSQEELYLFLETNNLPITEDGCFLAYKKVTSDYKDCHTRLISNKIGDKPSMAREEVDPNRNNTCSSGFHACSLSYLSSFPGQRTLIVKINPADVVSCPNDYNNAKLRCWTYEVVDEISDDHVERMKYDQESPAVTDAYDHDDPEGLDEDQDEDQGLENYTFNDWFQCYVISCPKTGVQLKALRETLGIKGTELAEGLQLSRSAIWSFENSLNPKPETIQRALLVMYALRNKGDK